MLDIVADLHLHSKYSRAVSPQMTLPVMAGVGAQKGIDVLATGDWTHPLWIREIQSQLEESEDGLYRLKDKGLRINDKDKHEKELRFYFLLKLPVFTPKEGREDEFITWFWCHLLQQPKKLTKKCSDEDSILRLMEGQSLDCLRGIYLSLF